MLFAVASLLERIYRYRYADVEAVCADARHHFQHRDFVYDRLCHGTPCATGALVPAGAYFGCKLIFASFDQPGPIWSHVAIITVFVSFFRYWVHRPQHESQFLSELSPTCPHQVTDLKAINTYVSNPIDDALGNILVYLVVGIVGFHPNAIVISASLSFICRALQHLAPLSLWLQYWQKKLAGKTETERLPSAWAVVSPVCTGKKASRSVTQRCCLLRTIRYLFRRRHWPLAPRTLSVLPHKSPADGA
jgi:hypothetical protein